MNKILLIILSMCLIGVLTACAASYKQEENQERSNMTTKVEITVNGKTMIADFYDNPTSKSILEKMPFEINMRDLYSREMCYRFPEQLPTDKVEYTQYKVGEIIYWPPMHSFVIMYKQNGEKFEMQKLGFIQGGVEVFETTGDTKVSFKVKE